MQRRVHPELPIFEIGDATSRVYYAAGSFTTGSPGALEPCARQAQRRWSDFANRTFAAEALTVYLSNRCSLACGYCYAASSGGRVALPIADSAGEGQRHLSPEAVRAAAEHVARSCSAGDRPFSLTVHGGGEPTLEWGLLEETVAVTRQVAAEAGLAWQGYVATNGVLSGERMHWLVAWFDAIGLSCDGPPHIQDAQRPRLDGGSSAASVERMAQVVASSGRRLEVRATITPQTMARQVEIAEYLCDILGAREIRFDPVYAVAGATRYFRPADAAPFAEHFLAAQRLVERRGGSLTLAGVRLWEVHGPHCSVLKDTLHLIPGDIVAGCFFLADEVAAAARPALVVGRVKDGALILDEERIAAHRDRGTRLPGQCHDCMNLYHCARDCPESCLVAAGAPAVGGFRCLVQRIVAEQWVLRLAAGAARRSSPLRPKLEGLAMQLVRERLATAPGSVDADRILDQAAALGDRLLEDRPALPRPVWARRGFEDLEKAACHGLRQRVGAAAKAPLSVYAHVPFCNRRCGFCDCYSVAVRSGAGQRQQEYVRSLVAELGIWRRWGALADRPVTTVHLGGGTPNLLDPALLDAFLAACRNHLAVGPGTEWALESTTSLLTDEELGRLWSWGFRRLHVGVQTLEPEVRRLIGRRDSDRVVIDKLDAALAHGFITSVDVVYGLPGQTFAGLVATLTRLIEAGVHGFSLYQLQRSPRNQRFFDRREDLPRHHVDLYLLLQGAEQLLLRHGYHKTHFTHFARPEDGNLYYGHPLRGEDLLGLGASADGVFGTYHYRHAMLDDYVASLAAGSPGLEGGLEESSRERTLWPVESALMAGAIDERLPPGSCLDDWLAHALVVRTGNGRLGLTGNGSWMITAMIDQVYREHGP